MVRAALPVDLGAALVVRVDELVHERPFEHRLVRRVLGDDDDARRVAFLGAVVDAKPPDHLVAERAAPFHRGAPHKPKGRADVAAELRDLIK